MIVVCGIPRSGTTWIGKILSQPSNINYFHEPDNEHHNLLGYMHKQRIPRFPYLTYDDPKNGIFEIYKKVMQGKYISGYDKSNLLIKKLLDINLESVEEEIKQKEKAIRKAGDTSFVPVASQFRLHLLKKFYQLDLYVKQEDIAEDKRVLIKSVHSILALQYLKKYFEQDSVIVIRHPANIIASHMKLENPDILRNIFNQQSLVEDYLLPFKDKVQELDHPLEKAGAQVAAIYFVLDKQGHYNKKWLTVKHENFCLEPVQKFKELYNRLDLNWSEKVERKISELNKSGEGYKYERKAKNQIDKWKRRLDNSQINRIKKGYSIFPPTFYEDFHANGAK